MDKILDIDNHENFVSFWTNNFHRKYLNEKDEIIRNAIKDVGIDFIINDDFIKENFTLITKEGDKFEHLYFHFGMSDEHRIISIEKEYNIEYSDNNGTYRVMMSQQYY